MFKRVLISLIPVLLFMMFGIQNVFSEEGNTFKPGDVLTLKQAISLSLSHNPDLKLARDQVLTSEITHDQTRHNFYPDLMAKVGGTFGRNTLVVPPDRTYRSLNTAITSTLNLFNGYSDEAAVKRTGYSMKSIKENYDRVRQQVVYNVITAYLSAVSSREKIRVAEENLADNTKQLEKIEAFYKAGRRPVTDVYQQQAETANARMDLLNARQDYTVNKMKLLEATGVPAITPFDTAEITDNIIPGDHQTGTAELIKEAFTRRADFLAQKNRLNAAEMAVTEARSGVYPSVSMTAGLSSSWTSLSDEGKVDQITDDNMDARLELSVIIPIFDRYLTRNQVSKAKITEHTTKLEMEKLERQIEVEIGEAVSNYNSAVEQEEVARLRLTYAGKALDSTRQRYGSGAATLAELTQSQAAYVKARYDLVDAGLKKIIQSAALSFYKGDMNRIWEGSEKKP